MKIFMETCLPYTYRYTSNLQIYNRLMAVDSVNANAYTATMWKYILSGALELVVIMMHHIGGYYAIFEMLMHCA